MIMSTNPSPINGISRKPGDVFGGGFAANSIRRSQAKVFGTDSVLNSISRSQGFVPTSLSSGSVDITSDNAAAILAAVQAVDGSAATVAEAVSNASSSVDITSDNAAVILAVVQAVDASANTVLQVQQNASSASSGADSQSWSDS